MTGTGPIMITDVLVGYAELVLFYREILHGNESPIPFKVEAAQRMQSVLDASVHALRLVQLEAGLEQTQRIVGHMRSDLPDPFDDEEDR
jgi:hypothetical protein